MRVKIFKVNNSVNVTKNIPSIQKLSTTNINNTWFKQYYYEKLEIILTGPYKNTDI